MGIHQQDVLVHEADAGQGGGGEISLRSGDPILQVPTRQGLVQLAEKVHVVYDIQAQRSQIDIDGRDLHQSHHVGPVPGDGIGECRRSGREVGLLQDPDLRDQRREIVIGIRGGERPDDRIHVRPDVHVLAHDDEPVVTPQGSVRLLDTLQRRGGIGRGIGSAAKGRDGQTDDECAIHVSHNAPPQ
jgi:hypothetical protein